MAGRLTLSWVNKDKALVPDGEGQYTWVARDDPRMTEVRLLHKAGEFGDDSAAEADNLLIHGDSYDALNSLVRLPELSKRYRGQVKLVYIDPPFNTGQAFEHYEDSLEHSIWLGMMRERLLLIRELLSIHGSVWVHLDDAEVAYCRVLMDEIFGRGNFVASIIWKRRNDPRNTATHISADHDFILCYTKQIDSSSFNQLPRTEDMDAAYTNPDGDERGPWRRGDLAARNYYSKGLYEIRTPSGRLIKGPPSGSYWRVSEDELWRLDGEGRIYWGPDGSSRPYVKRYLSEVKGGRVPSSVWHPEEVGFVRNGKEEVRSIVGDVFATPKPERLLQRVIEIGSNPGDIVLDCFAGSGTTLTVAHKMGRRWVGCEISESTLEKFTVPRLEKVVSGDDPGGITKSTGWNGGRGFHMMKVGPSLYERVEGRLLLAEWAKGEEFAQAVAAQLGFTFELQQPFSGRKGRTRLAVLDGVADETIIRAIVERLSDGERLTVVAKAIAPGTDEVLRNISNGSRLLKAPRDLMSQGRIVR